MRKSLLAVIMMLNLFGLLAVTETNELQAQNTNPTEIIIGDGTETTCLLPFYTCPEPQSESIYSEYVISENEMGGNCTIRSIAFSVGSVDFMYFVRELYIYFGTTNHPVHASETDWAEPDIMQLVYSCTYNSFGWEEGWGTTTFVLDEPYYYNGGDLIVSVGISWPAFDVVSDLEVNYTDVQCPSMWDHERLDPWGWLGGGRNRTTINGTLTSMRPNMKLTVEYGSILISTPSSFDLGYRPNGCSLPKVNASITNLSAPTTITSATCDNDFFVIELPELPITLEKDDAFVYSISTRTGEGNQSGTLTFTCDDGTTLEVPLDAIAYDPFTPDVWEMAKDVTTFPFSETIENDMDVHDNYQLPGNNSDGEDVVYKLKFDSDMVLTANITDGENGKTALYREGFEGQDGIMRGNFYSGANNNLAHEYECDFEDDDCFNLGWHREEPFWTITSDEHHGGNRCIKASNGMVGASSVSISFEMPYDTRISFWAKMSPLDASYNCYFYMDGIALIDGVHSPRDWTFYSYQVPNGFHTFEWKYVKGWAVPNQTDGFWLDDISFGFAIEENNSISLNSIDEITVPSGTYYLVASSTSNQFTVNVDAEVAPVPAAVSSPTPSNDINFYEETPNSISWKLGKYTTEFQILFGENNPPTDVLLDWTNEFVENYDITTEDAKNYYWRINERNSSGITEGPVWAFSTYKDINPSADNIIYVTPSGAGVKDGSSWSNAASNIQIAIDKANSIVGDKPDIWVSKGVYDEKNCNYQIISNYEFCFNSYGGVKIYGSFNGDESADYDLSLRDFEHNSTILDAQFRCEVARVVEDSKWDGFIFRNGKNCCIRITSGAYINNCSIENSAQDGVVVYWSVYKVEFHNCKITNNARHGVYQELSYDVTYYDCDISNNAEIGVYANCNLVRCKITNNDVATKMRAQILIVPLGGGNSSYYGGSIINCLIANNGIGTDFNVIHNSTIVNNERAGVVPPSYGGYDLYLSNNIIWGNGSQVNWYNDNIFILNNNAIQGGMSNAEHRVINLAAPDASIGLQPGFIQPSIASGRDFVGGDWSLSPLSPCVDFGSENDLDDVLLVSDIAGGSRIQQNRIDLGAYESNYTGMEWDTITVINCEGEPYFENGFIIPPLEPGDHVVENVVNNDDAPKIITILYHVNPHTYGTIIAAIDEHFELNGVSYSNPGEYIAQILTNQYDCDSIVKLILVPQGNISFADDDVKNICVQNWDNDGDGELSYLEAACVTDIGQCFYGHDEVDTFDELEYFMQLTSIQDYAFAYCGALNSFVIPKNVTSIGEYALGYPWARPSITLLPTTPPTLGFHDGFSYPIYVPYEALEDYQIASNWSYCNIHRWFPKNISGYKNDDENGGWTLIASPLLEYTLPSDIDNLIVTPAMDYDIFIFDQTSESEEWQNYKTIDYILTLTNGGSFLYANKNDVNLRFKGDFNMNDSETIPLAYSNGKVLAGWNLVGNPFPCNAIIDRPYWVLGDDHKTLVEGNGSIKPCEAVFVKAYGPEETVTFTRVEQ